MPLINRHTKVQTLTIANGAAESDAFDMRDYAGGQLHMPAAWTAASIGFKICYTPGGTYLPLYDEDATLVQISSPSVDCSYQLPIALYGVSHFKLWSQDGSAGDENQGAARSIIVEVKS